MQVIKSKVPTYSLSQVGEAIGVPVSTLYRWRMFGVIEHPLERVGNRARYTQAQLETIKQVSIQEMGRNGQQEQSK
jgi:DNA-binding transcriptional MerR regulator